MAVYDGALSGARILAHYQAGTNGLGNYAAAVQTDAPLAWWRLGEPAIPPSPGITANIGFTWGRRQRDALRRCDFRRCPHASSGLVRPRDEQRVRHVHPVDR